MQRERMTEALLPSLREYTTRYGLTARRVDGMKDDALVMHPGPMNRGVEISAEVADLPRSVIIDQVRNGVATRMAVLYLLLGQGVDKVLGPAEVRLPELEEVSGLMGTIVLKGGRVIDQTGERTADVVIDDDGRIAGVGADLVRRPHARRRRLRRSAPASSTCTATSASPARRRPRRSRPARGPRPSAATRASSPCPTRSRRSTTPASCARCSSSAARRPATCARRAPSPSAGQGSSSRRSARWPSSACGSSPTTAPASPTPA